MDDENSKPLSPPYISFRTFLNFLDRLAQGGIPQRIDRSYWGTFLAGGLGAQLMLALRFLGLIESSNGEPAPILEQLVNTPDERKQLLAQLLQQRYAQVFSSMNLSRATMGQLDEVFREQYKLAGYHSKNSGAGILSPLSRRAVE